jgi:hypothetical protein
MDSPLWNEPFDQFERNARKTMDAKLIPSAVFNGVKEGPEDYAEQLAQNFLDAAMNTRFYANQSRKRGLEKAKEEKSPSQPHQSKVRFLFLTLVTLLASIVRVLARR